MGKKHAILLSSSSRTRVILVMISMEKSLLCLGHHSRKHTLQFTGLAMLEGLPTSVSFLAVNGAFGDLEHR